jgi:hypothetical protein
MRVEWNKIRLSVRNQPLPVKLIQGILILNLEKIKNQHDWVNFYNYPKIIYVILFKKKIDILSFIRFGGFPIIVTYFLGPT